MSNRISKRRWAFTLIELLVVIAIIAILAAILFPVFARAKLSAKKTATLSNMKQLGLAVLQYLTDYDDVYPEAVQGGCTGQATPVNRLWGRAVWPYMKNKGIFGDTTASLQHQGPMRFMSNVPSPELGEGANPPPCNNSNTDRRVAPIGINRAFLSYFQCNPTYAPGGLQIGCKNVGWDPALQFPGTNCDGQFTKQHFIEAAAQYVLLSTTTTSCSPGAQGYIASAPPAVNHIAGLTSRLGEGMTLAFSDGHARFYPAIPDQQLRTLTGNAAAMFSPVQNRRATVMFSSGSGNGDNGVLNCVNFNAASVHWNVWASLPGENAAVDALCTSVP